MVFRMAKRVLDLKKLASPYSPPLRVIVGRLYLEGKPANNDTMYVAGKGLSDNEALVRLYGEAAERSSTLYKSDDGIRILMDETGSRSGSIPATKILMGEEITDLDSSGCATHNLMGLAIFNAVCELFERRAVYLWWYRSTSAKRLPETHPIIPELSKYVRAARTGALVHRETDFFLLTYDQLVHVVVARSASLDGTEVAIAFAANPNLQNAAKRAFLELLSVELETSDLQYARLTGTPYGRHSNRGLVAARQEALLTTHLDLFDVESSDGLELDFGEQNIGGMLSHSAAIGETILLADLTRLEISLPTCRAFFQDIDKQPRFPRGYELSPL